MTDQLYPFQAEGVQFMLENEGTLLADEQVEIDNYERVGHMLSLMKSKARRSLRGKRAKGAAKVQ